jgi:hypothetical protein
MARFVKINHGLIDLDMVVAISDPFWTEVEIKPNKKKIDTKPKIGPAKVKKGRAYGFYIVMKDNKTITILPSPKAYSGSGNTKSYTLKVHADIIGLLQ